MILRKIKTKFRRPDYQGSLKVGHGAEIRIAVPVPGEVRRVKVASILLARCLILLNPKPLGTVG
jgi:hypothetical protein